MNNLQSISVEEKIRLVTLMPEPSSEFVNELWNQLSKQRSPDLVITSSRMGATTHDHKATCVYGYTLARIYTRILGGITMKKFVGIFITLGAACLVVVGGLVFRAFQSQTTPPFGSRPVPVWLTQTELSFAQTPNGTFGVNAVLVTPKEMILFYEMQSALTETPNVEALSSGVDGTGRHVSNPLTVSDIQTLGKLAEIEVGAIRLAWVNQPNQALTLSITPSGNKSQPWEIAPLKQLAYDTGQQEITFLPIQANASGVRVEIGRLGGENNYAVLKISLPERPDIPSIFLRVDRHSIVSQITEVEFNTLALPVTSPAIQNPIATPAPTEKP